MKRMILLGSLFAICILLSVPIIPAVQYKAVMDTSKLKLIGEIKTVDIDSLEQKLKSMSNPEIQEKIKSIDFDLLKQKIKEFIADPSPIINFKDLLIFILCVIYMLLLGRPALLDIPYAIVGFVHLFSVITDLLTGNVTPDCHSTNAFIVFMVLNIIGLSVYKMTQNKFIGLLFALLVYLVSVLAFAAIATP